MFNQDIYNMIRNGTITSGSVYDFMDNPYAVGPSTQNWSSGTWNLNSGLPAIRRGLATNSPYDYQDAEFTEIPSAGGGAAKAAPSAMLGLRGFSGLKNLGSNSGWSLTGKEGSFGIGNTGGNAGLTIAGKNLAPIANVGTGIYQGYNAFKNLNSLNSANSTKNDLLSDIKVAAASNPMLSSYLTDDELSTLNKVKRGTYNNNASNDNMLGDVLMGAGKGALTGALGGLPGIIIGGIGGAINGGLSSQKNAQSKENATLEGLYNSLSNANAQYKQMRRPNYTGLGLQSRYTNQWM